MTNKIYSIGGTVKDLLQESVSRQQKSNKLSTKIIVCLVCINIRGISCMSHLMIFRATKASLHWKSIMLFSKQLLAQGYIMATYPYQKIPSQQTKRLSGDSINSVIQLHFDRSEFQDTSSFRQCCLLAWTIFH